MLYEVITYLTQSTWSHAALYIGDALGAPNFGDEPLVLIEADVLEGVRAVPLSLYADDHTRICRPVGISEAEISRLIGYAISRLGGKYDLKNIIDLLRYLVPTPPVPSRWRRQLLSIGSGDPRITSYNVCYTKLLRLRMLSRKVENKEKSSTDRPESPPAVGLAGSRNNFV